MLAYPLYGCFSLLETPIKQSISPISTQSPQLESLSRHPSTTLSKLTLDTSSLSAETRPLAPEAPVAALLSAVVGITPSCFDSDRPSSKLDRTSQYNKADRLSDSFLHSLPCSINTPAHFRINTVSTHPCRPDCSLIGLGKQLDWSRSFPPTRSVSVPFSLVRTPASNCTFFLHIITPSYYTLTNHSTHPGNASLQ